MKKHFLLLIALFVASMFVMAEMTIYVYKKDGTKVPYVAAEVDSVGFTEITHEYVDLGLSVMWATCNIGANSPEELGNLYQWGELIPCGSVENYKWSGTKVNTYIKYVTNSSYGIVDDKTELDYTDDVANVNWLGNWRMPSREEAQELIDNCIWSKEVLNGVNGYRVVSKINGNSIFMPNNPGDYVGTQDSYLYYWTNTGSDDKAYRIKYPSLEIANVPRENCFLVRPVYSKQKYRFTINFNANGAFGGMESLVVKNGATITLPNNNFYLDGTFIEWNTKADGTGTSYVNRATITPTEDMTLYAQWKLAYDGIENGHKYVDLGLSVKWATCNIGADRPDTNAGSLFAWGETKTKDTYCSTDYDKELDKKYNENKTVLELEDDAAHVNWGGNWRMPTKEEVEELMDPVNCTWKYSSEDYGYFITSKKNGNSIFLPATYIKECGVTYDYLKGYGYYWTSSVSSRYTSHTIEFTINRYYVTSETPEYGYPIRPVLP